jgi:acyl-CoA dehydrogenase family protein 9
MSHKRFADALSDVYAQIAVLSRVTSIFEDQGVAASGQEMFMAETFCTRAARRVESQLNLLERNDDERMHSIARLAYKRGEYGYALFSD